MLTEAQMKDVQNTVIAVRRRMAIEREEKIDDKETTLPGVKEMVKAIRKRMEIEINNNSSNF